MLMLVMVVIGRYFRGLYCNVEVPQTMQFWVLHSSYCLTAGTNFGVVEQMEIFDFITRSDPYSRLLCIAATIWTKHVER